MSFVQLGRLLQRIAFAALPIVALACQAGEDAGADIRIDAGPDASEPLTQVFTVQQPADPALQQLINSCATGLDEAACLAMCRRMFCQFGESGGGTLRILDCKLSRSGPWATITVTFDGRPACIFPEDPALAARSR